MQAVQDLTLKAMTAQTTAVLKRAQGRAAASDYTVFDSVRDIMDIQSICEVQKISSLVRNSILQAEPTTTNNSSGQLSTDVGRQKAVAIVGLNVRSPATFLQSQDISAVLAAVKRVGNLNTYADDSMRFGTASDVVTWIFNTKSDERHLRDVARSMGWSGE